MGLVFCDVIESAKRGTLIQIAGTSCSRVAIGVVRKQPLNQGGHMLDKKDTLAGKEGVWFEPSHDLLLDSGSELQGALSTEADNEAINECVSIFHGLTPFEFKDEDFVAATKRLDGKEFAKAMYRVYLKRECEHQKLDVGMGTITRLHTIERFRRSQEFNRLWAVQIEQVERKNLLTYLLGQLRIKITS